MMKKALLILILTVVFPWCETASAQYAVPKSEKSQSIVFIDGQNFYVHTVGSKETFYSLGKLYEVSQDDIVRYNPHTADGLKAGQVIKIPVAEPQPVSKRRESKLFDRHTVVKGETAYSIARAYSIPLSTIIEDNPDLDITRLSLGQQILIRKKSVGESSTARIAQELREYKDAISSIDTVGEYHIVKAGETLYSLARKYGVEQQEIAEGNDLSEGLKANMLIRIPKKTGSQSPVMEIDTVSSLDFRPRAARVLTRGSSPNIAVMLPLENSGKSNKNFMEFYEGVLLALEDFKAEGVSSSVKLFNTERDQRKVRDIVTSDSFSDIDLIIGPVYSDESAPAIRYAEAYGIPVISPLSDATAESANMFQLAPTEATKYDKLSDLLSDGKNIVVLTSSNDNREFATEIMQAIKGPYSRYNYDSATDQGNIANTIDWKRPNVFIVLADTQLGVDRALAGISSAYNNASARSSREAEIHVIGNSKWARYNALDKNLFFKLNVQYVSSYHADRTSDKVLDFDKRYIAAFDNLPSLYAYRGYDAAKIFVGMLLDSGFDFSASATREYKPLVVPYRFSRNSDTATHRNTEWVVVRYKNDYTIEVR